MRVKKLLWDKVTVIYPSSMVKKLSQEFPVNGNSYVFKNASVIIDKGSIKIREEYKQFPLNHTYAKPKIISMNPFGFEAEGHYFDDNKIYNEPLKIIGVFDEE